MCPYASVSGAGAQPMSDVRYRDCRNCGSTGRHNVDFFAALEHARSQRPALALRDRWLPSISTRSFTRQLSVSGLSEVIGSNTASV